MEDDMPDAPKIFTDAEIEEQILASLVEVRDHYRDRRLAIDWQDMAACVFAKLNEAGLIQHEP